MSIAPAFRQGLKSTKYQALAKIYFWKPISAKALFILLPLPLPEGRGN